MNEQHVPPSTSSVNGLYLTNGVFGSVIFIKLSLLISVRARFSSSHCKLLLNRRAVNQSPPLISTHFTTRREIKLRTVAVAVAAAAAAAHSNSAAHSSGSPSAWDTKPTMNGGEAYGVGEPEASPQRQT